MAGIDTIAHVTHEPADPFHRIGNNIAVDFANTVYSPHNENGSLLNADDVLHFLRTAGALSTTNARELRRLLHDDDTGKSFFKRALQLRSAIRDALEALDERRPVSDGALAVLNEALRANAGHLDLRPVSKTRYALEYRHSSRGLGYVLAPIAEATAELLASPTQARIRRCASDDCIRYFYDDSRTGRRRWCEMAICGNRAKTAAFVERRRASKRLTNAIGHI